MKPDYLLVYLSLWVACSSAVDTDALMEEFSTKEGIRKFSDRTKAKLVDQASNILRVNTPECTWCDALDAIVRDTALEVSERYLHQMDTAKRGSKDKYDIYFSMAGLIPTFNDLMGELSCSAVKRGVHSEIVEGLEKLAKESFGKVMDSSTDPEHQFGLLIKSVEHLSATFKKSALYQSTP